MSNAIKPNRKRRFSASDAEDISRPVTPLNAESKGQETPSSGSSTVERFNTELSAQRLALLRQTIKDADVTPIIVPARSPSLVELEQKLAKIAGATSVLYEQAHDSSGCETPEMDAETKVNTDVKVSDWLKSTVHRETEGPPFEDASSLSADVASMCDQVNKPSEPGETD